MLQHTRSTPAQATLRAGQQLRNRQGGQAAGHVDIDALTDQDDVGHSGQYTPPRLTHHRAYGPLCDPALTDMRSDGP